MKKLAAGLFALIAILTVGGAAAGGKPGVSGSCVVNDTTVTGSGLPTNRDLVVQYTHPYETFQQPAGRANADGTLTVRIPDEMYPPKFLGVYKIEFTSVPKGGTWGFNWKVFATCAP